METDFRLWLLGSWTSFFTWKKRTMDRSLQELVKPPGRIYEFEINVSNISGTVRNCESILMWIQQHKQSQIIMFHLHSLIRRDCFCAHIYTRLDLKTNLKTFVGVEAVNPREIHPHTEGTNTCTSRSVSRFDMFVFCFASDELPVSQTSLTCRSFLFLVPLEWILINKDGFPNKSRGETFYIEQLVKVSAAPLPWSEPSVQKVIMFIVC